MHQDVPGENEEDVEGVGFLLDERKRKIDVV